MSWNAILGVTCVASFFLPVAVIIYNRFYNHRSLNALTIYYVLTIIFHLMSMGLIPLAETTIQYYGISINYLDTPLILTGLLFFCPNKQKQRVVHLMIISFITYELIVTLIYGFNRTSLIYILGPGILLILGYTLFLFIRQVRFSIFHGKNGGRMFMLASILFSYACYALLYYFHYVKHTPDREDTMTVYFLSSFIAALLMTAGLHLMRKRMKELESLKVTRKELAVFFGAGMKS